MVAQRRNTDMELQEQRYHFSIAELGVRLIFKPSKRNGLFLLPSFLTFRTEPFADDRLFLELTIDDNLKPISKEDRNLIRSFDTGNGDIVVYEVKGGAYEYIIKDINGKSCALLITSSDFKHCACALNGNYNMRCFGLNTVMMLIFAFAGSLNDVVLIHASLVRHHGYGYAFIAKSGTGKSTQVSSWLRFIPDCDLMNDDNPIIRILDDGKPYIYGSPWSGKTPCYRNVKAPLGALTRIDRATVNSCERVSPIEAFASVLPSCSSMKWDVPTYHKVCDTVTRIIETTPIYTLHCLPDREAAEVCHKMIAR